MKKLATTIIMLALLVSIASAFSGSGSGTDIDPYQITTTAQFAEMNNDRNASYVLANDLDFTGVNIVDPIGNWDTWNGDYPEECFFGVFDGQGYTISNVLIDESVVSGVYDPALFGCLSSGGISGQGIIKNVVFDGVNLNAPTGAQDVFLIGYPYTGNIDNVEFRNVVITTTTGWASIISYPEESSSITNIIVDGVTHTSGGTYVSPLTSQFANSILENVSMTNLDITGTLAGSRSSCFSGYVGDYGGIPSEWTNVYCQGSFNVAGLAGFVTYTKNTAAVDLTITDAYYAMTGMNVLDVDDLAIITCNDVFYDSTLSGVMTSPCGIQAKTTTEMMQEATFTNWDFINTWGILEGSSYPYLQATITNTAPVIDVLAAAGEAASHDPATIFFSVTAYDPEDDPLTYSWYVNDTLQVGENNSVFTYDVTQDIVLDVMVVVSDGQLQDNATILFDFDLLGYEGTYTPDDVGAVVIDTGSRMILGIPASLIGVFFGMFLAVAVFFSIKGLGKKK